MEIKNLKFFYKDSFNSNRKNVFTNLNFTFKDGKNYCILGEGGSGKTTLIKLLTGVYKPISGALFINSGVNMFSKKGREAISKTFGVVPHPLNSHIFTNDVFDEFSLTLSVEKLKREEIYERINKIISLLNLNDQNFKINESLYRRILEIGCGIIKTPIYLLLDEPFLWLDKSSLGVIKNILFKVTTEMKINLIIFTHTPDLVRDLVDEVVLLKDGQIYDLERRQI